MTDSAVDAELSSEADPPRAGGKKKLLLLVVAPLLALLVAGGVAFMLGLPQKLFGGHHDAAEDGHHAPAEQKPAVPKETVFFDLPDLLVNLNAGGRKTSFLKISIAIELEDANDLPKLQSVLPRIIDNFQVYLRELRAEDLKGSAGMYRLREELLVRVNNAVAPAKINDVLFKEMLVQ